MAQPSSFVLTAPQGKDKYGPCDLPSLIDQKVHPGLASFTGKYVGAVGLGSSGVAYLGIGVEFPGALGGHSIRAEQFLVANLALHSEPDLTHLAFFDDDTNLVLPCSHCYYLLQEIHEPPNILIKNQEKNEYLTFSSLVLEFSESVTFNDLPPHPFPNLARLLEVRENELYLFDADGEDPEGMKHSALYAAKRSFSPYTESPSGVALKDRYQNVYSGWYMESIIDSASFGPLQAALVDFMIRGGTNFEDIVEAVLVERIDAKESQAETVTMILLEIAPNCPPLTVFYCLEP